MPDTKRLACLQTAPVFGEVETNLARALERLTELEAHAATDRPPDLVVLPELFSTGYAFRDAGEMTRLAEPWPHGPTGRWLVEASRRTGGVVVGGFAERDGTAVYNAAGVAAAGRALASYRKTHLFGFEPEAFASGSGDLVLVEHAGMRVGVMICFDWIHPEVARALARAGADVIAHPSNLVLPWCQRAMPVRALENGVFTVTANRVGTEHRPPRPALAFTGASLVAGPRGEVLAEAPASQEATIVVAVDLGAARDKTLPSGDVLLAGAPPDLRVRRVATTGRTGPEARTARGR